MRRFRHIPLGADNFLSVLEGVEGGFAIFAGIIIGLNFEGVSRELLLLTAGISIVVNAFNASAVRFASEHYMDELDGHEKRHWFRSYLIPSLIEFLSYIIVSLVAVVPLIIVHPLWLASIFCVVFTLLILFIAGWYRGTLLVRRHAMRDGVEVAGLGLVIIAAGGASGWILSQIVH